MTGRTVARGLLLGLPLLAFAGSAQAQTNAGPSKCVGCHDHERPARKWQKEEPAAFKGQAHFNTRKQLEAPKSAEWAKAIGLADPYDLKGSCVKCHATVFRGESTSKTTVNGMPSSNHCLYDPRWPFGRPKTT